MQEEMSTVYNTWTFAPIAEGDHESPMMSGVCGFGMGSGFLLSRVCRGFLTLAISCYFVHGVGHASLELC